MDPVCLENICWNHNNDDINLHAEEIQIERDLSSLLTIFSNNSIQLFNESLLHDFDEYALGSIIYNWWYIASMFTEYLNVATSYSLQQNESLMYSLLKHNYDEENGYFSATDRKHSLLLRQSLNAVLNAINLPLIGFEDFDLHYLSPQTREIFLVLESYELRRGIFSLFGGRMMDTTDSNAKISDMSALVGSLICIELQASKSESWLWRVLTMSNILKNKMSMDILQNEINPYFEEHLYVKQDNIEPGYAAEETHAVHAFIMAKQLYLRDKNNWNTIKNAFLLYQSLETNVFDGILNAIQRQQKNFNYLSQNIYL